MGGVVEGVGGGGDEQKEGRESMDVVVSRSQEPKFAAQSDAADASDD